MMIARRFVSDDEPEALSSHRIVQGCAMAVPMFSCCCACVTAVCSNPILLTNGAERAGRQRFNYLFYIDFVGALSDPVCQNALRHLQVRILFN